MDKKLFADLVESLRQHNAIIAGTAKPARVTSALILSLTPKALARRIARERLRDDRTLLKKVRTSLSPSKARKRSPAKTLQDHEGRIRAIESILFGKGHSSQKRQWLLEGIGKTLALLAPNPSPLKFAHLAPSLMIGRPSTVNLHPYTG
jgi:hypothetical protein